MRPSDKVGCIRNFRLKNGGRIRERLLALSDYEMSCTYSILESPMGVENYLATLRLIPVTENDSYFRGVERRIRRRARSRKRHSRRHRPQRLRRGIERAEDAFLALSHG